MPAKAGNDTIALALVLDLEHHALVGLVRSQNRLGDDAVETSALKATKPVRRYARIAGCGRQVYRQCCGRKQRCQHYPTILERHLPQISISFAEKVEKHDR